MQVPCTNCNNLEVKRDPDGLLCRCSLGFYDQLTGGLGKIKNYYAVSGLVHGNVSIWKACKTCNSHKVMEAELAK